MVKGGLTVESGCGQPKQGRDEEHVHDFLLRL